MISFFERWEWVPVLAVAMIIAGGVWFGPLLWIGLGLLVIVLGTEYYVHKAAQRPRKHRL